MLLITNEYNKAGLLPQLPVRHESIDAVTVTVGAVTSGSGGRLPS